MDLYTFSVRGQKVNIVGFLGHKESVPTIQLCLVVQKLPQMVGKRMNLGCVPAI